MFFETEAQSMKEKSSQQSLTYLAVDYEELHVAYAYGYVSTR